jgi:hypothetical protein
MFPWGTVFLLFAATSTIAAIEAENPNEYYYDVNETSSYNVHRRNGSSSTRSYQHMIEIEPKIFLHWNDPDISKESVAFQMVYYGTGWIALGFSHSAEGVMIGSDAVIGIPSNGKVQYYDLASKDIKGIQLKSQELQKKLSGKSITQSSTKTVMCFTKSFSSDKVGHSDSFQFSPNGINTFIYAYGTSNELGYHAGKGMFQLDLSVYSISTNQTDASELGTSTTSANETFVRSASKTPKLIKAHGVLATLAFLVTVPIATSVVILREATYLKQRWFCLHMGLNFFAWCSAVAAVSCAVTAVSKSSRGHFNNRHEIIGIIIIVALTFHIVGALCRPEEVSLDHPSACTKRLVWKRIHQCLGLGILILGLAQVYDGMLMAQHMYGVKMNLTAFFWAFFVPWLVLVALLWTLARSRNKVGIITTDERTSSHKAKESQGFTKLCNTDEQGSSGLSMEACKTHSLHGFTKTESCAHESSSRIFDVNEVDEEFPLTDLSLTDPPQAPQPEEKGIVIGNDLNV